MSKKYLVTVVMEWPEEIREYTTIDRVVYPSGGWLVLQVDFEKFIYIKAENIGSYSVEAINE